MSLNILTALIGFIGVVLGAVIQKNINGTNNSLKYITDERKKWRDDIRKITEEMYLKEPDYMSIRTKLKIRLNPLDSKDEVIIDKLDSLIDGNYDDRKCETVKKNIVEMISKLLKHDWERAKQEANSNRILMNSIIIVVLITISILIEYLFYNVFKEISILKFIKNLIGINILFYSLSTGFIMVYLIIMWRLIISIFNIKLVTKSSDKNLKLFKKFFEFMHIVLKIPYSETIDKLRNVNEHHWGVRHLGEDGKIKH